MNQTPSKVLIVLTSHNQMGNTGQKTGFWLEEFASPYYVFVDAGAEVTVASIKGGEPPMDPKSDLPDFQTDSTKRFMVDAEVKEKLKNTLPITSVNATDYDAIFLPGGHGTMWDFPTNETLTKLIESFNAQSKLIAAVCHAPAALVAVKSSSGEPLVKGKTVTGFTDSEETTMKLEEIVPFMLETQLRELGANFKGIKDFEPHVEQEDNLITGQNPASSEPAAKLIVKALSQQSSSLKSVV